jgi:hypothetical protein
VNETEHFVNEGFGWECRRCRETPGAEESAATLPRFFREGEAEGGAPRLSTTSLARWADESRTTLRCTACGVEEKLKG